MKILIDYHPTTFSRIENENSELILRDEITDLLQSSKLKTITDIKKTLSYYINLDINSDIDLDKYFKNDNSVEDFEKLVEFLNREEIVLESPELAFKLKNAGFAPYFQKLTYITEEEESFDKVVETLLNQKSYALLKLLYADKENSKIVIYSSVFGLWNIEDNLFFKKIENKSKDVVRTQFTITKILDSTLLQKDIARTNFAVYEDLKALFDNEAIERVYKDKFMNGEWKTDETKFNITKYHFNIIKSTESEIDEKAKENLSSKKSRLNRGSVTQQDVRDNIERNPNKIHTILKNISMEKFEDIKRENLERFKKNQRDKLRDEFELRLKEMELEEIESQKQKIECRKEYVELLQNGMNLSEAKQTLKSRYLDLTIVLVEEDIKSDIVALREIGGVNGYLITQHKAIDFEQRNKTNYENYLKELELRQKKDSEITLLNSKVRNYETVLEQSSQLISNLKISLNELNETIKERDKTVEELESELESKYELIERLKNENKSN